jgi:phenylacetic acid degradation operon negative regulatory protein
MFAPPHEEWDGCWCIVALSVPEVRRDIRDRLRKELTWLGFGSPSPGMYVSPHDHQLAVERLAEELDALEFLHVFRASTVRPADPRELVTRAWPELATLNRRYGAFYQRFSETLEVNRRAVADGRLSDEQAFRTRFELASEFRHCLYADPDLPPALAPRGWRGQDARRLFHELHALVTPGGMRYFDAANAD